MKKQGRVTFVVGLAGSGKSWLIKRLRADWVCEEGFMMPHLHERNHRELVRRLLRNQHCVISELQFMNRYTRIGYEQRLWQEAGILEVRWIFFAKNLRAANANCRRRRSKPGDPGGKGHIAQNKRWAPYYKLPAKWPDFWETRSFGPTEVRKIFQPKRRR